MIRAVFAEAIGRNPHEKAMNYLRAQPGGAALAFDDLHARASELVDGHTAAAAAAGETSDASNVGGDRVELSLGSDGRAYYRVRPLPDAEPPELTVLQPKASAPFMTFAGRNPHEKAIAWLRAQPQNQGLDFDALHLEACKLVDANLEGD